MAAVEIVQSMTLNEPEKMYNVIQHSPSQSNCVIVSSDIATKTVIQSKRPLAPAPERNNTVAYSNGTDTRCKKKIQFMAYGSAPQQPASVQRRNARERNRVKQVNNGFAALRQHIPANVLAAFGEAENSASSSRGGSKKLSKVETLRVAVEYIKSLQRMLEEHEAEVASKNLINAIAENRFFPGSPESVTQQYSPYTLTLPTPPSSEASASPTPSQTSELSTSYQPTTIYVQESYKTAFETKSSDAEELLLDAIFSWQQSE